MLLGMMVGLGVGIDYALFIVTRYREAVRAGHSPRDAIVVAMSTAGRAVAFAGATVVVSMLGLLLVGIGMLSGMGHRRLGHGARHHVHVDDAAAGPARHGRASGSRSPAGVA